MVCRLSENASWLINHPGAKQFD